MGENDGYRREEERGEERRMGWKGEMQEMEGRDGRGVRNKEGEIQEGREEGG